jgi:hypothetical protein
VLTAACHTWQPRAEAPDLVIREEQPDKVRLHMVDWTTVTLHDPKVSGDSLTGWVDNRGNARAAGLDYVRGMDVAVPDPGKTAGVVALSVLGTLVVLVGIGFVACKAGSEGFC